MLWKSQKIDFLKPESLLLRTRLVTLVVTLHCEIRAPCRVKIKLVNEMHFKRTMRPQLHELFQKRRFMILL